MNEDENAKEKHKNRENTNSKKENDDDKKQSNEYQTTKKDKQIDAKEQRLLAEHITETRHFLSLRNNSGKQSLPKSLKRDIQPFIDEQDQFTPDNWIPRSQHLKRLTGTHPLNAEPHLADLFSEGLITPTELHYVRNHGAVPKLD